jgi:small subunit ribosomal protein S1
MNIKPDNLTINRANDSQFLSKETSATPYVIALDGPSGTGKSTTAKEVARALSITYLDTGAMYRALTYAALQAKILPENLLELLKLARTTQISFNEENLVCVNGICCAQEIRTPEVSGVVSLYCQDAEVRRILTEKQREIGSLSSCILDGRDIGTVVFPNAQFKFFMNADYRIRAERRALELASQGSIVSVDDVEKNLKERDYLDSTRAVAPLVKAEGAIEIDTTHLSIQQQVEHILHAVKGGAVYEWSQPITPEREKTMSNFIHGTDADLQEMLAAEAAFGMAGVVTGAQSNDSYTSTMSGLEVGKVVQGYIRQISDVEVLVDVSFKSEGVVDRAEFKDLPSISIGDAVDVFIEALEDSEGRLVLSKQRADFIRVWEKIREAFENNEIVKGRLVRRIKGGVVVDLFGIEAFLPGSQIDLRQIPDINALIGLDFDLKVIKVNKARRNIVVSRRVVLEEERSRLRGNVLDHLDKGQVRKGVVKNITDFGAFIDLGGVDGLLHITDMSYRRINHPSELVELGQELDVKVLDFNENKERISLGLKQMQEHPWHEASERYPEGMQVTGKVVSITDYGAFIELGDGIEGLIHVSEMSWTQHVKHPSKILTVGQDVSAVVLKVDVENEKISLGLKQLEIDPWENIETELPPGAKVTGEIRNLASFGAFVEIKEGVDGLIHVSDMSWTKKINHPSEVYGKNDKVECVVLAVDRDKRRISLSVKHLEEDPWENVETKYSIGLNVQGKIVRLLDRGVVLELEAGMEGFIPTSKLTIDNIKVPSEAFKIGEELPAVVIEVDHANRKLYLSTVDYFKTRDGADWQSYLANHKSNATSTLGESGLAQALLERI